ncbi:hypothetical protein N658DRAFT_101057 [Parathielavia hyrcaniae]|uniref:Uncharacterized protein n=1 Tax=Parathielavia hyrcaniae TaxID=113614 RepID=A0AAN6T184_9PEZI|nr:hypothetical protein N658DRAFT_101057 [Parathielavia hyrcaniae]
MAAPQPLLCHFRICHLGRRTLPLLSVTPVIFLRFILTLIWPQTSKVTLDGVQEARDQNNREAIRTRDQALVLSAQHRTIGVPCRLKCVNRIFASLTCSGLHFCVPILELRAEFGHHSRRGGDVSIDPHGRPPSLAGLGARLPPSQREAPPRYGNVIC